MLKPPDPTGRILIIDDEPSVRKLLHTFLIYKGYSPNEASSGAEGLDLIANENFDTILLDIQMPGMDGMEVLGRLAKADPDLPVIMISGHGTIETAVEATKKGAFDFLEKPLDRERVLLTVRNAISNRRLASEKALLEREIRKGFDLIGESPAITELKETITNMATAHSSVLISGESGVGKGVVARSIHRQSARAQKRLVEVSCAAIPDDLIESTLMGHEKGAFTGATSRKLGKFELADRGTIFLDEIGDMSPKVQAKVLRVIEEQEFERLGGTKTISVDVRVIAATNKDLPAQIKKYEFREDLYYRLNVIPIKVSPLRERIEDIPVISEYFLNFYCQTYGLKPKRLDSELIKSLQEYSWPGNVRELRNIIERMVITSRGESLTAADLPSLAEEIFVGMEDFFAAPTYEEFRMRSQKVYLERKLKEFGWNISNCARSIGVHRNVLYAKIRSLGIKPPARK